MKYVGVDWAYRTAQWCALAPGGEIVGEGRIADARKVKTVAPLAAKTDKVDARLLAELSRRELVPGLWLPSLDERALRERLRRIAPLDTELKPFAQADPRAAMTGRDVDKLVEGASITRNRAKIRVTVENARAMRSASPSLAALAKFYPVTRRGCRATGWSIYGMS